MIPRTEDMERGCTCDWLDEYAISRLDRRCAIAEHQAARWHERRVRALVFLRRLMGLKP